MLRTHSIIVNQKISILLTAVIFYMSEKHEEVSLAPAVRERPLSPHLSIYKPQFSSMLSIGHRATGVALFFSISMITWWFICLVFSGFNKEYFLILDHFVVKMFLFLVSYAFFYHLCTGIRHLVWDCGVGFSIKAINASSIIILTMSFVLTIVFWLLIL
jgi:succinate dehydrogenase / fumarate reductase cytochrome b subunit